MLSHTLMTDKPVDFTINFNVEIHMTRSIDFRANFTTGYLEEYG